MIHHIYYLYVDDYVYFTSNYHFLIISFPFGKTDQLKVVIYQIGYGLHDKVGGDTIIMHFKPPWSIKKQIFVIFAIYLCAKYLLQIFHAVR